jgi:hypothetical protein
VRGLWGIVRNMITCWLWGCWRGRWRASGRAPWNGSPGDRRDTADSIRDGLLMLRMVPLIFVLLAVHYLPPPLASSD